MGADQFSQDFQALLIPRRRRLKLARVEVKPTQVMIGLCQIGLVSDVFWMRFSQLLVKGHGFA